MPQPSLLSVLRERAGLQPDDTAFTYTDYELDWEGVHESLTWAQACRRALDVAHAVRHHGSSGEQFIRLDA